MTSKYINAPTGWVGFTYRVREHGIYIQNCYYRKGHANVEKPALVALSNKDEWFIVPNRRINCTALGPLTYEEATKLYDTMAAGCCPEEWKNE